MTGCSFFLIKKETMKGMFLLDQKRDHEGSVAAVELCLFFCITRKFTFFLRQYVTVVLSANGAEALPPKWERNWKEPPARVRTRKETRGALKKTTNARQRREIVGSTQISASALLVRLCELRLIRAPATTPANRRQKTALKDAPPSWSHRSPGSPRGRPGTDARSAYLTA